MKAKKSKQANLENKRSTLFLIGLVLALGVVLSAFEWKVQQTKQVLDFGSTDFVSQDFVFIPPTPAEDKLKPKAIIEVPVFEIVDDHVEIMNELELEGNEPTETIEIDFSVLAFDESGKGTDKDEEILITAEIMPEFPGGQRALLNFLSKNVKYPVIAQENGITGKVFVSFVIDEAGDILNVELLRGADPALDKEALRVVSSMPKWQPGMQGGKTVKVRYTVPINFQLQ
jgi:protein TonB